jgi:hypothetical protein
MLTRLAVVLALPVIAACASGAKEEQTSYRAPVVSKDVKSGGPDIRYGVERTGLEFQVDRGTKPGEELLGGKVVVQRVTDDSTRGALQAAIQVKSCSGEPVFGLCRVIFFDDKGVPVGSAASVWQPLAIDQPFGTAVIHAQCVQRKAVYFVLEAWQGAQAKADRAAEKK